MYGLLNGDDPTCQIHVFVHDFCLMKAREESCLI
ncbi:hypothetical protein RDI58_014702 [Solanum bulbocastanum]|uniref:Uncharacterized protein n=1 Tax=Solanum bulbocastanum TaxID=147425 RepID=A0AAN8YB96_SOLBU